MKKFLFLLIAFSLFAADACKKSKPIPKPVGYYRISLPQKQYKHFGSDTCKFSFDYPVYARIVPQSTKEHKCWMDIVFPSFNAKIYLTYYDVTGNLAQMIDDSYTLVYKHTIRADDITQKDFVNPDKKVYATLFDIKGNSASSVQFHITDSTKHFIRGSLYFNNEPNSDSLAPVIRLLRQDIVRFIESFSWND